MMDVYINSMTFVFLYIDGILLQWLRVTHIMSRNALNKIWKMPWIYLLNSSKGIWKNIMSLPRFFCNVEAEYTKRYTCSRGGTEAIKHSSVLDIVCNNSIQFNRSTCYIVMTIHSLNVIAVNYCAHLPYDSNRLRLQCWYPLTR